MLCTLHRFVPDTLISACYNFLEFILPRYSFATTLVSMMATFLGLRTASSLMALAFFIAVALGAPRPGVTSSVPAHLTPRDSTVDDRCPLDPYDDSEAQKVG